MAPIALTDELIAGLEPKGKQQEFFDLLFPHPGSFGVRVGSAGRKSFFLIYGARGHRQRYPIGTFPLLNVEAARLRAVEVLRQVDDGRNPAWELRAKRLQPTLSELSREFLERGDRELRDATRREYRRILSAEILPVFGLKRVSEVTKPDLDQLYSRIAIGRGSRTMGERACALLKSLLRYAVQRGHLASSSIADWQPPERKDAGHKHDPFRLPLPDLLRLWVLLGEEDPLVAGPFRLILLTGQRPNLVLSMKWSQIRNELWFIPQRVEGAHQESFAFFLSPPALSCLKSVQEQLRRRRHVASPWVFPSRDGGPKRHLRKTAFRLSQRLGLRRPFSPLALRNAVREHLYEIGVRPDVVQRILYPQLAVRERRGGSELSAYNYGDEVRQALLSWSRRLTTVTPIKPFSAPPTRPNQKVVPLFPAAGGSSDLEEP